MGASNYLENKLLDHVFGGGDFTRPATVYFALSIANPTEDASGLTEPSGNAYARVAVTNNATNFPAASGGSKSNGSVVTFPQSTGSWGTITHYAIMDASSDGNMLDYGALTASKAVGASETISFAIGAYTVTMD
ncbi:MAG: hypothetical protein NPIRA02_29590 [Nitrospirales bacterium]|nr:MAG: hypothetical protein NPIRA02_29590 [Nitrospirales bacterium]